MKIVIVGCGKVGKTLAERLNKEKHDIVVIDIDSSTVEDVTSSLDIMGIVGNGASYAIQEEAGISDADLLLAVTNSDELNLLCCLIGKKAGVMHTIARVRNPIYNKEIEFIREELGLSAIINPEQAAADEIVRLLRFPSAIRIDGFARGMVEMIKFKLPEDSILVGKTLAQMMPQLHSDILVCAIERDGEVIIPGGSADMRAGDNISFIAGGRNADNFFREIHYSARQVSDVMIAGGGKIAYYLAKELIDKGIDVKIVEQNKERCDELSEQIPKATIIQGDATDQEVLLEEGIDKAQSFVALTNIDEENILLSLFVASRTRAKRVTKVNRIGFADVVDKMDLGSLITPKFITAESILQYVRAVQNASGNNVETLYQILGGKAEALAFNIKEESAVVGKTFEKLQLKDNLLVCSIVRRGKVITPKGHDMIYVGDTVIVVTTHTGLNDIKDILA